MAKAAKKTEENPFVALADKDPILKDILDNIFMLDETIGEPADKYEHFVSIFCENGSVIFFVYRNKIFRNIILLFMDREAQSFKKKNDADKL